MAEGKYYWFKMEDDFFQKKEIKKLRKIAGGDTFVLIYLKLVLKSLKNGGKLFHEGFEDDFSDEIALEIDESPDNVKITLNYLLQTKMVIETDIHEYQLNDIGIESKTASALRVAKHREKKALQCNKTCNGEIEIEKEKEKYKEKKQYNENFAIANDIIIESIYKLYPTKCYSSSRSTGKSHKDKDKIRRILKTMSSEKLIAIIERYLDDCLANRTFLKNFGTFLNNLPDYEENNERNTEPPRQGVIITLINRIKTKELTINDLPGLVKDGKITQAEADECLKTL